MKKQLLNVCVAFAATLFLAGGALAQHEAPIRAENCPAVTAATAVPYVDGVADEANWSGELAVTEMFNAAGYDGNESDLSGYVKVCWDNANLYFFADITDDVAINWDGATGNNYEQDNCEVFLDQDTTITNADGAYIGDENQLRYNRGYDTYAGNAARNEASFDDFIQVDGAGSWQVEAVIPWLTFMPAGTLPEDVVDLLKVNGGAIGFDVAFADNDTELGANRDIQMAWDADEEGAGATEDNGWKDTRVFGVLTLTGVPYSSSNSTTVNGFEIFPNPANNVVNFRNVEGVSSIEIINLVGQTVKVVDVTADNVTVNVADLAAGNYFARLNSIKGSFVEKVIIK
ncbi:MAG: T9SS type A sorting domain-containing protein [Bacteroidales bacterium]|nr:T9SS type A sorting domain-containing protein [Bacteroidales bacterium]MBN2819265.1 T9SS type A sorting domain-containing protein [Bacteroidales bacterium]